jgi:hypothetical protein
MHTLSPYFARSINPGVPCLVLSLFTLASTNIRATEPSVWIRHHHQSTTSRLTSQQCGTTSDEHSLDWYHSYGMDVYSHVGNTCQCQRYGCDDWEIDYYWNWPDDHAWKWGIQSGQPVDTEVDPIPDPEIVWQKASYSCERNDQQNGLTYFDSFSADTQLDLQTFGGHTVSSSQLVVLQVNAWSRNYLCDAICWDETTLPVTSITLCGKRPSFDGKIIALKPNSSMSDITPTATCAGYRFSVANVGMSHRGLDFVCHPKFLVSDPLGISSGEVQSKWESGSLDLGTDDDAPLADNDPGADALDDVPFYACFDISFVAGLAPTYTTEGGAVITTDTKPVFSTPYHNSRYFDIRNDADCATVVTSGDANMKVVNSIYVNGQWANGAADESSNPPRVVVTRSCPVSTYVHEWMHTRGCSHRSDAGAFMYPNSSITRNEINRSERAML